MNDNLALGLLFSTFGLLFIAVIIIFIIIFCFYIMGKWKLFKKAGKNGWEAIIPFYSDWVYVEIAGLNYWWFFLVVSFTIVNFSDCDYSSSIASICSLIGLYVCNYNISKKLHKDAVFAVLMTVFPFILLPIIGLSDSYSWDSNVCVNNNGPFNNDGCNNMNSDNSYYKKDFNDDRVKYCSYCGVRLNKYDKFCNKCGKEV